MRASIHSSLQSAVIICITKYSSVHKQQSNMDRSVPVIWSHLINCHVCFSCPLGFFCKYLARELNQTTDIICSLHWNVAQIWEILLVVSLSWLSPPFPRPVSKARDVSCEPAVFSGAFKAMLFCFSSCPGPCYRGFRVEEAIRVLSKSL